MFSTGIGSAGRRWYAALLASFSIQCLVLFFLLHHSAAVLVLPTDVDLGIKGSAGSVSIVYLAPVGSEKMSSPPSQVVLRAKLEAKPSAPKPKPENRQSQTSSAVDAALETARGGSPWGHHVPGSALTGDEVIPALPEVFPDPPIARSDLPKGVEGDVIVEVTIDAQGNVTETKLLHGLGYGIEDKVLAVLRQWHFRPAMRDGVTIASQHVVYFHYPS